MTENLKWFKEMQDLQTDTTKSSISQVENMKAHGRFLVGSDRKRIHQHDFFEEVTIDLKFCILSPIVKMPIVIKAIIPATIPFLHYVAVPSPIVEAGSIISYSVNLFQTNKHKLQPAA